MHGIGFEKPLQSWFDFKIPKTQIAPDYIAGCLETSIDFSIKPTAKVVWLGNMPQVETQSKSRKGQTWQQLRMTFHHRQHAATLVFDKEKGEWLLKQLAILLPAHRKQLSLTSLKADFEERFEDFELFWFSKPLNQLKGMGLLVL